MVEQKRTALMAGNWKMNHGIAETEAFFGEMREKVGSFHDVDIMIAPQAPLLSIAAKLLDGSNISLGAQNCHNEISGAFTGELSTNLLKEIGCTYVIIGHSERRTIFGETDDFVRAKTVTTYEQGLIPLVCVGESLEEREAGKTFERMENQVGAFIKDQPQELLKKLVIAYEPIWAIGTGETATKEQAQEVHAHIRRRISEWCGEPIAQGMRILYGGSVKPANVKELMAQPDIDGALVGGASLKVDDFAPIVEGGRP
jgi:triosephosphate isomerase (TIM)